MSTFLKFISIVTIAPLNGMTSACDTLFPQLFGSNDKKKVGIILQKGCIISLLTAIVCTCLLYNAKSLMFVMTNEMEVIKYI